MPETATTYTHEIKINKDYSFQIFITIPWEQVEERLNVYAQELRRVVFMPGYRPGRAPVPLIRRVFRKTLEDRIRDWLPNVVQTVVEERAMDLLGTPHIVHYTLLEGQPLVVECRGRVWPPASLKPYEAVRLPKDLAKMWEREERKRLEREVETLREKQAILHPIPDRGAREGDTVSVRFTIRDADRGIEYSSPEGETVVVTLGSSVVHPVVTRMLVDHHPGDTVEWEMDVTLRWVVPEEPSGDQGEPPVRRIQCQGQVENVYRVELPTVEDILEQEGFESLEEWMEALRERLGPVLEEERERFFRDHLLDALLDDTPPLPDAFLEPTVRQEVESYLREHLHAYEQVPLVLAHLDAIRQEVLPTARQRVARIIALHHLFRRETIDLTEEDRQRYLTTLARRHNRTVESLRASMEADPDERSRWEEAMKTMKLLDILRQRLSIEW